MVLASALLLAISLQAQEPADVPTQPDPQAIALAKAVDLATPEARREAARELARSGELDLEGWLERCRAFSPLPRSEDARSGSRTIELEVLGQREGTEVHLHVPRAYDHETPAPLLVALHGAGGSGVLPLRNWRAVADGAGAILLCPTEAGRNQGFTGEPRERAAVLAAIRWARRRFNVDENRIWLTGYSRGGTLAWDIALRSPGVFAGVVPMAGAPRVGPEVRGNNMRFLANLSGVRVHALAGSRDHPLLVWSMEHAREALAGAGIDGVEIEVIEGAGHSFDGFAQRNWSEWFAGAVRDPWANELTLRAAHVDAASRSWARITSLGRDVSDHFEPSIRVRRGQQPTQEEIRAEVIAQVDERTATLHATRDAEGTIRLRLDGARKGELLVRRDWIDEEGRLRVRAGNRSRRRRVEPSVEVLLEEFVESFDRTFLPVARVAF